MKVSLKAMRVNAKMTQKEAAEKMHIAEITLIKWENETGAPNLVQFSKLCDLYGCSPSDILLPKELVKTEQANEAVPRR